MKRRLKQALELGYAFRLVWESGPWWCIGSMAVMAVRGVLPLVSLYILKQVVDLVVAAAGPEGTSASLRRVFFFLGLAAGVALLEALCRGLGNLIAEDQSQTVADCMQERIQKKSAEMDLAFYETPAYQDTLHRAQVDARFRPLRIVNEISGLLVSLVSLAGVAVVLFAFHWGISLVLCAGMAPGVWYAARVSRRLFDWRKACTEKERKAFYLHWVLTGGLFAQESKSFGFAPELMRRFRELRQVVRAERLHLLKQQMTGEIMAQTGGVVIMFGGLVYLVLQTVGGVMTVGSLVMFAQALRRAEGFIRDALQSFARLYEDSLFLRHIREFMELQPEIRAPEQPVLLPAPETSGLRLAHVSFRYPETGKEVLHDVTMELKPGRHVALVGPNGSGKSTLIKLLCRFYDPEEGVVEYGGQDIRGYDPAHYRRLISPMFQDFNRYYLTARENIWLGRVEVAMESGAVEQAARLSEAHEMISRLGQGYETLLGRLFRSGVELSHGEWQKIALARTFLSQARLLVLDEPSSFLDANAEERLFDNLKEIGTRQTLLFVSHRFSTVRRADWIYVLDQGRIVGEGNHESLLRDGGLYAEMFHRQAKGYCDG